jgi:hypothetical protein
VWLRVFQGASHHSHGQGCALGFEYRIWPVAPMWRTMLPRTVPPWMLKSRSPKQPSPVSSAQLMPRHPYSTVTRSMVTPGTAVVVRNPWRGK